MSASSKKKLRNAEQAMQMTERQLAEQKEAKKLKIFSIIMVAVVVLMVGFAAFTVASTAIENANRGKEERSHIALSVGEHELSAAEFNCFFIDAVSNFYGQYGSYASLFGLDVTKALDKQYYDEAEEITWADEFINEAQYNAKAVYGRVDEAKANGFTLSEDDLASIDSQMAMMDTYAVLYGYNKTADYIQAMYGDGCNEEILRNYLTVCYTAQAYQNAITDALEFSDADIKAEDEKNAAAFSNFTYNYYYLAASKFLEGGTKGEDGTTTYSDEENAAALAAAEAAAQAITTGVTNAQQFDLAVKALPINAESTTAASTACEDYSYDYINSVIQSWVTDASRQPGDITYIPSVSTDSEGKETTNGYYAVLFGGRNDNEMFLQNVRHILVKFEGGKTDDNGNTTYSDEEKAAAKTAAEAILADWKAGEATEDSFAALANEKSDDGDGTTGGLYENVYPGQMVTNFNDWLFDAARQVGDTDVIETEYGYHVMYYVGAAEQTYREYQIVKSLTNAAVEKWYTDIVDAQTLTAVDMDHVPTGMILSSGN